MLVGILPERRAIAFSASAAPVCASQNHAWARTSPTLSVLPSRIRSAAARGDLDCARAKAACSRTSASLSLNITEDVMSAPSLPRSMASQKTAYLRVSTRVSSRANAANASRATVAAMHRQRGQRTLADRAMLVRVCTLVWPGRRASARCRPPPRCRGRESAWWLPPGTWPTTPASDRSCRRHPRIDLHRVGRRVVAIANAVACSTVESTGRRRGIAELLPSLQQHQSGAPSTAATCQLTQPSRGSVSSAEYACGASAREVSTAHLR